VIEKEVRALLPAWTACALAIVASRYQIPELAYLGLPAYLVGAAGLGAWSIGHEYAYGTMASMLALPVQRRRWWTAKLAVLAPSLAALAALAAAFVVIDRGDRTFGAALFWLTALAALSLAPWITMLARSPLAGAVLTIGVVGMSIAAGDWIGVYLYGYTPEVDGFRRGFLWWMLGGSSALGAIGAWRTFAALQVADADHDLHLLVRFGTPTAAASRRRRRPLAALVLKELQLQQLAFVVAALYTAGNLAVWYLGRVVWGLDDVVGLLVALYIVTLPAVIGSLACAEERHFGTDQGQLLLPVNTSLQWLVKSAMAVCLAIVLGVLLPAALGYLLPREVHLGPTGHVVTMQTVFMVLGSLSVSLYVSTLARSGLAALMYSVGAIPAVGYFVTRVAYSIGASAFALVHPARPAHGQYAFIPAVGLSAPALAALLAAIVAMALPHYRSVDRRPGLAVFQAALAAAGIVVYEVVVNVVMALRQ
jgi:ABC-type transport system involved in multi-copper enzyme maturation permease subunit